MRNISFDNPYLLLTAIPAIIIISVVFFIAIRKENRSKSPVASFIIHIAIVILATLALAGTVVTTVMTETDVYVVADISYSSDKNLDKVDAMIKETAKKLPLNSKMGLVCFGRDYKLVASAGESYPSVKKVELDNSGTNISGALDYTATLFRQGTIKRIVLITDGKQTDSNASSRLIASIENLYANGIKLDTVFLDNNLKDGQKEMQVSSVSHTSSTYLNHQTTADVLIQSSYEGQAIVELYQNGVKLDTKAPELTKGYNIINFTLPTDKAGSFDYEVRLKSTDDSSAFNNSCGFSQTVTENVKVLLVSNTQSDLDKAKELYGSEAQIDAYINTPKVPGSIEEICKYDEIIISGVDVRSLQNYTAFVDAVDKAVSLFGKSLVTMGDLMIQNKTDEVLKQLENMLPVRYGNNDNAPKVYGLVIDTSRSMFNASHLAMAKQSAIQLLSIMGDEDYVTVISFAGDITVIQAPTKAKNREEIAAKINAIQPKQGTFIGKAMEEAYKLMTSLPSGEKQIMLISDGMSYTLENDDPVDVAAKLKKAGVVTSTINTQSQSGVNPLKKIAATGGGNYYYIESEKTLEELIFSQVADDMTETVIEKVTPVYINRKNDENVSGITSLPSVTGYVYSSVKASAYTVLYAEYIKSEDDKKTPPILAKWNYGNGKVTTLTTSFTGAWTAAWQSGDGQRLYQNILECALPEERIDYPFTLNVDFDGTYSTVEIVPAVLNPYALAKVSVTAPSGEKSEKVLTFDSTRYYYSFETPETGKYTLDINYSYDNLSFDSISAFNISYSPEYDSFVVFDPSDLHTSVRNRGTVSENGKIPNLENSEEEIDTYKVYYTAPFLVICICLYIIDIIIRKIKWNDIKGLFVSKAKGKGAKA